MSFFWRAKYADGGELRQFPESGGENKYGDIDRARLKSFEVWQGDKLRLVCHPNPTGSLIYRRRNSIRMIGARQERSTVVIVGWRERKDGKESQTVAAVFESGHVEMAPSFKRGDAWFYPPSPHANEGEVAEYEVE